MILYGDNHITAVPGDWYTLSIKSRQTDIFGYAPVVAPDACGPNIPTMNILFGYYK